MKHRGRSIAILLGKILIAAALIWYGISRQWFDPRHFRALFSNWHFALPAALLLLLIPGATGIRWALLVRAQGIDLSLLEAVKLSYIGLFWSLFLPGAVTGDFFKAYYIARGKGREKKTEAVTTVFLDRVVGLFGLTLLASCVIVLNIPAMRANPKLGKVAIAIGAVLAMAIASLAVMFHPRVRRIRKRKLARRGGFWQVVDRVDDAIHLYRDHKATVLVTVGMSVSFHVLQCTVLWLFAGALGGRLAYTQMLLLAPVGFIVNAIPITPGGLGLGETGFQTLLAIQGLTVGGATFLCWRISNLIAVSPGAIIWALHRTQLSEAAAEASDAQEPAAEDPAADPAGEPS